MSELFPKPRSSGTNVKIELDLSNYATKYILKMWQELTNLLLLKKLI